MTRACLMLTAFAAAAMTLTGCGPKLVPVTGVVTMNGQPVEGASVTFQSDDGVFTSNGFTDASGNFALQSTKGAGAFPASYKVVVAKYKKVDMASPGAAQDGGGMSKEYTEQMKKNQTASKKNAGGPAGPAAGSKGMPPGAMMGMMAGGGPMGGAMASSAKSELPEVYASFDKTPLKVTVPSDGPVKLELKDEGPTPKKK